MLSHPFPHPAGRHSRILSGLFVSSKKNNIASPAHDIPCLAAPFIRFFQEKIRCHTDTDYFAALYFISSRPVFGQRVFKPRLRLIYIRAVFPSHRIKIIYITVLTPFTAFYTSMPWIPIAVHSRFFTSKNQPVIQTNSVVVDTNLFRRKQ